MTIVIVVHFLLSLFIFPFAETKPIDLYEFLVESELQQYYNSIKWVFGCNQNVARAHVNECLCDANFYLVSPRQKWAQNIDGIASEVCHRWRSETSGTLETGNTSTEEILREILSAWILEQNQATAAESNEERWHNGEFSISLFMFFFFSLESRILISSSNCRHFTQRLRWRRWEHRIRQANYQITNTLFRPTRYVWTKSWESANSVSFNKVSGQMAPNE